MKSAYNVRFWNFKNCTAFQWENYAGGMSYIHKAQNEQEAREYLTREGWEIKTYYKKK